MNTGTRILLSRFLTRTGDQAWDFGVPLVLLTLYPGSIRIAAIYYLIIKLSSLFLLPAISKRIDRRPRKDLFKVGIGSQTVGLLFGWLSLLAIASFGLNDFNSSAAILTFGSVVVFGVVSSLGAALMEISVGMDLAVDLIPSEQLSVFNSRLKFLELVTEVGVPVGAGFLLFATSSSNPMLGFSIIAIWNLLSFIPEYWLLKSTLNEVAENRERASIREDRKSNVFRDFFRSFREFSGTIYAIPVVAYAFLWLSVLSPHGALLTAFLKGSWQISEVTLGVFRGLGALFGVLATFLFPFAVRKLSLYRASLVFIFCQVFMVLLSLLFFRGQGEMAANGFLFFILLSRIGLYGFSLGEMEIRQKLIPVGQRGAANGVAHAMTSLATIGLFVAGAFLPKVEDFSILVYASGFFVFLAFALYFYWFIRFRNFK